MAYSTLKDEKTDVAMALDYISNLKREVAKLDNQKIRLERNVKFYNDEIQRAFLELDKLHQYEKEFEEKSVHLTSMEYQIELLKQYHSKKMTTLSSLTMGR